MKLASLLLLVICALGCASRPQHVVFSDSTVYGYACKDRAGNVTRYWPNMSVNYGSIHHCDVDVCGGASWTCPGVEYP